jgi:uncharacterized protein DUF6116
MSRSCVRDDFSTRNLNRTSSPRAEADSAMNPAAGASDSVTDSLLSDPGIPMPNLVLAPLLRWFGRLSYPKLFLLTAILFVGDMLVPDVIPLVDELLLGLGTLLLANWKRARPGHGEAVDGGRRKRR